MSWQSFVFGGLLPIIAFTVLEEKYGPIYGLVAAMIFGIGEVIYEKVKLKKVSQITWIANTLIIALGLVSIFTQEGVWFKLQPAIMEAATTGILWGTQYMKKPLLVEMSRKQNPNLPDVFLDFLRGVNFRVGLFFLAHAILATWAALKWSTQAWAWLKGLGVMLSMFVYMFVEVLSFRLKVKNQKKEISESLSNQNKI